MKCTSVLLLSIWILFYLLSSYILAQINVPFFFFFFKVYQITPKRLNFHAPNIVSEI